MSAITELAQRLGKTIADSSEAKALKEAREALDKRPEVKNLMREFQEHSQKIMQLQSEQKPIEVADKQKLEELQSKLLAEDIFKQFTAAQVDYVDIMRKVNETIRKELEEIEGAPQQQQQEEDSGQES